MPASYKGKIEKLKARMKKVDSKFYKNSNLSKKNTISILLRDKPNEFLFWWGTNNPIKDIFQDPLILNLNDNNWYFYSNGIENDSHKNIENKIFFKENLDFAQQRALLNAFAKKLDKNSVFYNEILLKLRSEFLDDMFLVLDKDGTEKQRSLLADKISGFKNKYQIQMQEISDFKKNLETYHEKFKIREYETDDLQEQKIILNQKLFHHNGKLDTLTDYVFSLLQEFLALKKDQGESSKLITNNQAEPVFNLNEFEQNITLDADELKNLYYKITFNQSENIKETVKETKQVADLTENQQNLNIENLDMFERLNDLDSIIKNQLSQENQELSDLDAFLNEEWEK
ncbi:MAG: hypothetical protein REH79_00350 [Spiroplasma sp.]|nr:hypothetical protein [Spiroplasma sp.]